MPEEMEVEMHEELHHSERADQGGASTNAGEVGEWHRGAGNGLPAIPRSRPLADPSATVAPKQGKRRRITAAARFIAHRRYAHAKSHRLRRTAANDELVGLQFEGHIENCDCDTCMRKNAQKRPFKQRAARRATVRGYRIHSDLKEWPTRSKKGYKYSICFVCDATRRGKTYPMKKKDDALQKLKQFLREECAPRGIKVRVLRSDNGGEYIDGILQSWCASHTIRQEFSPPDCQSGNGVAENYWREMARYVRSILWDQQRGDEWWPAALRMADSIRNVLESDVVDGSGIPEVQWTGESVDVAHFRVPLSTAWTFIEKAKRDGGTLGDRRMKGVLVGYARDSACYEVYDPLTERVYNRRHADVICDEREAVPPEERTMKGSIRTAACSSNGTDSGESGTVSGTDTDSGVSSSTVGGVSIDSDAVDTNSGIGSSTVSGVSIDSDAEEAVGDNSSLTRTDQVTYTPAVPATRVHGREKFLRLSRAQTIAELAGMFACTPTDYLRVLHQYDGWYQQVKNGSTIAAGSDVPVPGPAAETRKQAQRRTARPRRAAASGGGASSGTTSTCIAASKTVSGGGSSSPREDRRSRRILAAKRRAAVDAAALSALAIEYERLAKADAAPSTGPAGAGTAMYIADVGGGDADSRYESTKVLLAATTAGGARRKLAAGLQVTYDDEPRDVVYYEALASGEIPIGADDDIPTPKTRKQALSGKWSGDWIASEKREWDGLWAKEAFLDVPYTGQHLHHLMWVYKVKSDGTLKSRLVADGRQQDPTTYGETASPTMRTTSFRMLLAIAAMRNWGVWADDATQAFLCAERPKDKPLWAAYPTGKKKPGRCLLVQRHLYGFHDSPMGFFLCLRQHLLEDQGFIQSPNDECLFIQYKPGSKTEKARAAWEKDRYCSCLPCLREGPYPAPIVLGDVSVMVTVHVDDFASTGDDAAVTEYRRRLYKRFPCTGGPIKEYYGLDVLIDRKKGVTKLSASSYVKRMLKKLGIKKTTKVSTPMVLDVELKKLEGECTDRALQRRYRTLVGCVLHTAVTCRPDVAAAARALSTHLQHPGKQHETAALRVVHYLATTSELALTYGLYKTEAGFYGTCDASHGTENGAKGVTGWAFHLAGGAISWKSRTQGLVALSSTEAELIAVDDAARELRYLQKLLADVGITAPRPTLVGQDNQSTCLLVGSKRYNPRTRHLALRYHHTGDLQRAQVLQVQYLPTEYMPSDVLTKQLPKAVHWRQAYVILGHMALQWKKRVEEVAARKAAQRTASRL